MFNSKKILLFPGKLPKKGRDFTFLPIVRHIFTIPMIIKEDLNSFLQGEEEVTEEFSILGEDVSYLICHPEVGNQTEIALLVDQLQENGERIIVLGPEKIVYEIFNQIEDSHIYEPEEGDKECFVEFCFPPDFDIAIPLSVHEVNFGKTYLN